MFTGNLSTNGAVMVSRGLAYSLVIEGAVPYWDSSKIACRPLYPNLTATSVLAWKREQPFSLAATKGFTYLHFAAQFENPVIVKALLENGANVNAETLLGASSL